MELPKMVTLIKVRHSKRLNYKIKSDGIFGKSLFIEPGFGNILKSKNQKYVFNETQDSYSVDMFLRYLKDLNE